MKKYNIAKEFTAHPAGRTRKEGEYSGERFREILDNLLKEGEVTLLFDGLRMKGSSFLDEAFGGLVKHGLYTKRQLDEKLHIKTSIPFLEDEIRTYIKEAKNKEGI